MQQNDPSNMNVWRHDCVTRWLYDKMVGSVWQHSCMTSCLCYKMTNMTVCDKGKVWQYDCLWQGQGVTIWQCVTTWLCVTRARCENKTVCDNMTVCDKGSVWQVSVITLILIDAAAWAGETGGYFPRLAPWEPSLPTHDLGPSLCHQNATQKYFAK